MTQQLYKDRIIHHEMRDGDVLTGTLPPDARVTIAPGATVTLRDVDITQIPNDAFHQWAGITCEGDATLILEGTSRVQGGEGRYPGIFIGVSRTLVIQGVGSLDITSQGMGAGIGGGSGLDCGNIVIESGVLHVTGGEKAAAIGGGYGSWCGDITIHGGTIEAHGGKWAAAIGSGSNGTCGDITVSTEAQVVAVPGRNATDIVGAGFKGSAGTIKT